jgi:GNAT superfamily N-acetyltransferase
MQTVLTFHRLSPHLDRDRLAWREVFRGTPSFTYTTEGRIPTDSDADRMIDTLPDAKTAEDAYIYAIYANEDICGAAYVAKDYPAQGDANLVLLVLMQKFHGRFLGVRCVRWIAETARSWGCARLCGVVDTANERSATFWERLGFIEDRRTPLPGLVGEAIVGHLLLSQESRWLSNNGKARSFHA